LGSTSIAGLDAEELDTLADELDAELAATGVELDVDGTILASDPVALGAGLDREAVTEAALDARRSKNPITGPIIWISSFFTEETIEPTYLVDESVTEETVEVIAADGLDQPREPELALQDDGFTVTPGRDGIRLVPSEVAEQLLAELEQGTPYTLELTPVTAEPELDTATVEAIAAEANEATDGGATFQILDQSAVVEANELREWIQLDTSGSEPTWLVDPDQVLEALKPKFPTLGTEDQKARFNIVDGEPIIIPASETVICCTPESVDEIRQQLQEPLPEPEVDENGDEPSDDETIDPVRVITLQPEIVGSDEGVAELESLGIIEEVSTFTTNHACCQNRVTNIQRFADLMRGVVIRPGEELSLNGYVGRRTIENGFVADGAIANGVLEQQVGGGVSQFATTFFNAAFYAGIEIPTYQSHSLYISRYPRGREATISFPNPDLVVVNSTDYGILVWPTYTPTSITVTFYSTKHIEVEDLPLVHTKRGLCDVYTTPRVRTYPDGTQVEDSVFALYRPGEGLNCQGESTVPTDPSGPTVPTTDAAPDDAAPVEPTPVVSTPATPAPTIPPATPVPTIPPTTPPPTVAETSILGP
jgi:vancomycin resistance protein YoaR